MEGKTVIRGLTLWQPWAWAVAHAGKTIENRPWAPPAEMVGQLLAIHAGLHRPSQIDIDFVRLTGGRWANWVSQPRVWTHGAIVAVARLHRVVTESDSPWFFGPFGWELTDVRAIQPVSCKGRQRLWRLPQDVEQVVLRRYREGGIGA